MRRSVAALLPAFLILTAAIFGSPDQTRPQAPTRPQTPLQAQGQTRPQPQPLARIKALFHKANHFFSLQNSTPADDSMALTGFTQVIDELRQYPGLPQKDTLLFQSWLKIGVLLDARYNYLGANQAYNTALHYHTSTDSLAFVTYVYTGASYYNLNNFDSASYFLLKAEALTDQFRDPEDKVRLYNTLGVLYYDNGNYQQGRNYFTHALDIIKKRRPFDTASAVSLQINIATCFYHLGQFPEALAIYTKILGYHLLSDQIYMNRGLAYASLEKYREAMTCFRKVNARNIPNVFNEMGLAELKLHQPDSAAWFLDQLTLSGKITKPDDWDIGTNNLYKATLLASRQQYAASLTKVQKAIIYFCRSFNNEDIYTNPSDFTGTFASYRLLDAMLNKAGLFDSLYHTQPKEQYLLASYEAYKTTLSILRYIEKSYDTDDAKIFLKKKNAEVYQGALAICLQLYRLHPDQNYLEQAFLIGEKNKASIITANLRERSFNPTPGTQSANTQNSANPTPGTQSANTQSANSQSANSQNSANQNANVQNSANQNPDTRSPGKEGGLLQHERNIKYNIARLNVRSEETHDRTEADKITAEKAAYEIELSRLQKELEHNSSYYKLKYDDTDPGLKEVQRHLDDQQALISLYATKETLHIFIVTRSSLAYTRVDSLPILQQEVEDWLQLLKTTENGRRFKGAALGSRLYTQLIKPIQTLIPQKEEWIIIPDGFLYFLPFESLPANAAGATLLETTTISYQFSARLIGSPTTSNTTTSETITGKTTTSETITTESEPSVLAFAPFADRGTAPSPGSPYHFNRLPASRQEVAGLSGVVYIDSLATKGRFLTDLNKYPILHLATHAVSSIDNAAASFIAFYPATGSPMEDCLYLEELYGLNMNNTKLAIISACETGEGELVSNEGVISLARAFAYAGCQSSIHSLWQADDKATSFILQQFHAYLQKGYTKSKALRQAKLDYLNSDAINKSPAYWSHLVLMGNTAPLYEPKTKGPYKWGLLILFLSIIGTVSFYTIRNRRNKPGLD